MKKLTKEDVWGKWSESNPLRLISRGMIVAQGVPSPLDETERKKIFEQIKVTNICPVWKDKISYKSVTVICDATQAIEVSGWLEYVHGGGCIEKEKTLPNGKYAIRSNYECW